MNINIAKPHGIFWGNNSPGTGNLLFQSHLVLDKDGKGRETNPSVREFFEDQQLGSYDAEKISKVAVEGMLHAVARLAVQAEFASPKKLGVRKSRVQGFCKLESICPISKHSHFFIFPCLNIDWPNTSVDHPFITPETVNVTE